MKFLMDEDMLSSRLRKIADGGEFLTSKQLAEDVLGIKVKSLYAENSRGAINIPAKEKGRKKVYAIEHIVKYLMVRLGHS